MVYNIGRAALAQVERVQRVLGARACVGPMLRLNVELMRLFSTGVLPATAVQRLAKAAWGDGWGRGDELAARLSRAGSAGGAQGTSNATSFAPLRWQGSMRSALSHTLSTPLVRMAARGT